MEASIATATRLRRDCHVGGDNVASARRSSRQISSLGPTISSEELQVAVEIPQSAGGRLVSDETYGVMTGGEPLRTAACADPTAVSLSTMSKTFGLRGFASGGSSPATPI
jgi:Aminotransferase class I and II